MKLKPVYKHREHFATFTIRKFHRAGEHLSDIKMDSKKVYQVFVKGLTGQTVTVDIASSEEEFNSTTILQFKEALIPKLPGINVPDELRLIYNNSQLEDKDPFSEYKIVNKSTIFMVVRLRGGGGHIGLSENFDWNSLSEKL